MSTPKESINIADLEQRIEVLEQNIFDHQNMLQTLFNAIGLKKAPLSLLQVLSVVSAGLGTTILIAGDLPHVYGAAILAAAPVIVLAEKIIDSVLTDNNVTPPLPVPLTRTAKFKPTVKTLERLPDSVSLVGKEELELEDLKKKVADRLDNLKREGKMFGLEETILKKPAVTTIPPAPPT